MWPPEKRLLFTNADQRIVLSGKAEFWQGKNLVKGEEITVWIKEDRGLGHQQGVEPGAGCYLSRRKVRSHALPLKRF